MIDEIEVNDGNGDKFIDSEEIDLSSEADVLRLYFQEVRKYPLLTRNEEIELVKKAKKGDSNAKEKLISSHLRFVISVAKDYRGRGVELMDLISEGNVGLIRAFDKFDLSRNIHFISYAVHWIKSYIQKACYSRNYLVCLPANRGRNLIQIKNFIKNFKKLYNCSPSIDVISENLKISSKIVKSIIRIIKSPVSLQELIIENSDKTIQSITRSDKTLLPEIEVFRNSLKEEIDEVLATLTKKEATIIRRRYGLNGTQPCSLTQIGQLYGLTKERIRQIEKKTLERLQQVTRARKLVDYYEEVI